MLSDLHLDTCAHCNAETWCETRSTGKPQCLGCKVVRFYRRVLYPPLGLTLLPWGEELLRALYGTIDKGGLRQYRQAYVSMGKKGGKSFWTAGLPIYHLLMEDNSFPGQQIYGAAAAREQGQNVFGPAAELVKAHPELSRRLKILPSTKRILNRNTGGFYSVISADGDVNDGINPSLAIIDELHRWKTERAHTLYQVLLKGQRARTQPLAIEITTAGAEYESDLWKNEYDYAARVLNGSLRSDHFYAKIWEADRKRNAEDPDYWKSRGARLAANPSHEDHGGFIKDSALVIELEKALANPSEKQDYCRYTLNLPVLSDEEPAIDMAKWMDCGGGVDLRTWPVYDTELLVRKWGLLDRPCWAGVDLSSTIDLTALSLVFPPTKDDPFWSVLAWVWMPHERIRTREERDHVPYSDWVQRGFVEEVPGDAIESRPVGAKIKWAAELFDLREVCFDRFNARELSNSLTDEGLTCVDIAQNFLGLSAALKKLFELYITGKLRHGNNPAMNWCASCLSVRSDGVDNIKPAKPDRGKSRKRIDVISATVTAMARAIVAPAKKQSVYETRGILTT